MPDDAKKILEDIANGKLPDIKKTDKKDLSKVRYNIMYDEDVGAALRHADKSQRVSRRVEKKGQVIILDGGVMTKERKTKKKK